MKTIEPNGSKWLIFHDLPVFYVWLPDGIDFNGATVSSAKNGQVILHVQNEKETESKKEKNLQKKTQLKIPQNKVLGCPKNGCGFR